MNTILFIEDENALQKAFEGMLSQEGYEVIHALDGEAGVRMARQEQPDLVLLDLVLPKKDGFEVLQQLKENPETSAIPVIVLTNLEDMSHIQKALNLGAKTYLVKSNYQLGDIIEKVRQALNSHE